MTPMSSTLTLPRHLLSNANGNILWRMPHNDNDDVTIDEAWALRTSHLMAVVHRRAEVGGAECNVLSCVLLPSPLLPFTVCVRWLFMGFRWERGGVAVLCGGSPASSVAQAGKEGRRSRMHYCPPPSYALHLPPVPACCTPARWPRAAAVVACFEKNKALSRGWCMPLTRGSAMCEQNASHNTQILACFSHQLD